jgi:hypothetical protein
MLSTVLLLGIVAGLLVYFATGSAVRYEMGNGATGIATRSYPFQDYTSADRLCNELSSPAWKHRLVGKINAVTQPFAWAAENLWLTSNKREGDKHGTYVVIVNAGFSKAVETIECIPLFASRHSLGNVYNDRAKTILAEEIEKTCAKYASGW